MQTTIDRFGRVVIPKGVRDSLALEAGELLVIEVRNEGILLRPVRETVALKRKGRVLVFTGQGAGEPANPVRRARDERLHRLARRGRG